MTKAVFSTLELLALLLPSALLLGGYMARVFRGERTLLSPGLRPLEKLVYRLCRIDENREMPGRSYALCVIVSTLSGCLVLFLIQLVQGIFPLNPQGLRGVRWDTALNTAISFATNTNWQAYAGETTMSPLTQMLGLAVQNFLSAAVGIAVAVAMIRGFARKEAQTVGNFWVDLVRSVIYVLLPLALVLAVVLVSQGVVQTLRAPVEARTLESATQVIPMGPVASQEAIKELGTNGGGYYNANSAHPFENPNGLTNLLENFALLLIPTALVFSFGIMVGNRRQGRALLAAMLVLFALGLGVSFWAELSGNPLLAEAGVSAGSNLEGKEMRFGVPASALWAESTTATSTGAVNSAHDSDLPLSGLAQLFNMGVGEVIFGGVGVGLIGMLFYVVLAMFVAGLMIGRTPEFLGKKLGAREMIMAVIGILLPPVILLSGAAMALLLPAGLAGLGNPSAHGLSEILYAYTSAAGNNGSAMAGLSVNTPFYNLTLGLVMLIGRFATLLPGLAIGAAVARKRTVPSSIATFPTTGPLFVVVLVGVILLVGALTYFPAFSLGPILEHLFLGAGRPA
ncbi:MAG: potassium-transporting ATPase subunit KdpA [Candidatus Bipolaricaulota bacterium]|nr:potassium-transporting ATPase subunit KdpA [Candidatus Bipolaricaulota bacterium]